MYMFCVSSPRLWSLEDTVWLKCNKRLCDHIFVFKCDILDSKPRQSISQEPASFSRENPACGQPFFPPIPSTGWVSPKMIFYGKGFHMTQVYVLYTGGTIGSAGSPLAPMSGPDFRKLV